MKISGHLDLCGPTLIEGWLYAETAQDEPLRLQVYVGKKLIGEVPVNRFRQDLLDAGFGTGHCGFSFAIPPETGLTALTETRLRIVGTPLYLLPSDATIMADIDLPLPEEQTPPTSAASDPGASEPKIADPLASSRVDPLPVPRVERRGFSFR